METRIGSFVFLVPLILTVAGCASEQPTAPTGVASGPESKLIPGGPSEYRYTAPNVDFKKFTKIIIEPVAIYKGADAQFGDTQDKDKQEIADYMQSEFTKQVGAVLQVVYEPGPGVARLRLALAGLELSKPGLSVVTHALPVGLVLGVGKEIKTGQGWFLGSVTFAGEIYDSQSDTLIAAFVSKESPGAMDLPADFSGLDSAKACVAEGAEKLKAAIEKMQKGQG
ncbi:MAG TPA: DUF3313 domain-containing protein [Burkholderiales bacterium]|nr:DUF3313 domain-containing protein [Burkholderiales bacterium]